MPAFPFYGGPPRNPDILARATVAELIADLDGEGVERALVLPNYGVPDASISFGFNPLVLEAAAADDRIRCGLWVSPARRTPSSLRRPWPWPERGQSFPLR
jgi:uncharacterized protein